MWSIQVSKGWVLRGPNCTLPSPSCAFPSFRLSDPLMVPYRGFMESFPESICTFSLFCPLGIDKSHHLGLPCKTTMWALTWLLFSLKGTAEGRMLVTFKAPCSQTQKKEFLLFPRSWNSLGFYLILLFCLQWQTLFLFYHVVFFARWVFIMSVAPIQSSKVVESQKQQKGPKKSPHLTHRLTSAGIFRQLTLNSRLSNSF